MGRSRRYRNRNSRSHLRIDSDCLKKFMLPERLWQVTGASHQRPWRYCPCKSSAERTTIGIRGRSVPVSNSRIRWVEAYSSMIGIRMSMKRRSKVPLVASLTASAPSDAATLTIREGKTAAPRRTLNLTGEALAILSARMKKASAGGWIFAGKTKGTHILRT